MKPAALWVIVGALLSVAVPARACVEPSASSMGPIADAIIARIDQLEAQVPVEQRRARPAVMMKVVLPLRAPAVDTAIVGETDRSAAASAACVHGERLHRATTAALQGKTSRFAVVSADFLRERAELSARFNAIGSVSSIDADTVRDLRVLNVNYVVVLGARPVARLKRCGVGTELDVDIDVLNLETSEVLTADAVTALIKRQEYLDRGLSLELVPPAPGKRLGSLRFTASAPMCLRKARVEFEDEWRPDRIAWTGAVGCVLPDRPVTIPIVASALDSQTWPSKGKATVSAEGEYCGSLVVNDIVIQDVVAPGSGPPAPAPTPAPPMPSGFPPGFIIQGCGCWGPVIIGAPVAAPTCQSRTAMPLACPFQCMPGVAYQVVCQ